MRRVARDKWVVCVPKAATRQRKMLFKMIIMSIFLNCMLCSILKLILCNLGSQRQEQHEQLPCNDTALTSMILFNKKGVS